MDHQGGYLQRYIGQLAVDERHEVIVEPCSGQIKSQGSWWLLLRGIEKARGEWALIATVHDLLKYRRVAWQPA